MRILPRSRRGMWLLAGVTWLVGCGVVWWSTPEVPRIVVEGSAAGFTADGRWVYGWGEGVLGTWGRKTWTGPMRLWDAQTGELIVSRQLPGNAVGLVPSGDWTFGRNAVALISEGGSEGPRLYLFDWLKGQREPLPWVTPTKDCRAFLTCGGRYLVFETDQPESPTTCWWDRTTRQIIATLPGLSPFDVKSNGRWVTEEPKAKDGDDRRFVVREPITGRESARIVAPSTYSAWQFCSDDNDYFILCNDKEQQLLFELPGVRQCLPPNHRHVALLPDLHQAVVMPDDGGWLIRLDLTTGQEIARRPLPPNHWAESNGRYILSGAFGARKVSWWDSSLQYLARFPLLRHLSPDAFRTTTIIDPANFEEVAKIRHRLAPTKYLSPDGRTLVTNGRDGEMDFWDVPPPKSLRWFTVAASMWALPVALLAFWRVRRLRTTIA